MSAGGPRGPARDRPGTDRSSARAVAAELVRRVTDEGAFSNRLLPSLLPNIPRRDRALAVELGMGTLRRLLPIDHALAPLMPRTLRAAAPRSRAALRLGAYQVLFTRVPAHAAVGETVGLALPRERGFVNAVLRRLAREGASTVEGAGDDAVALRTGLTPWAVRELRRLVGEEAEAAAAALARPGVLTVRANPCRIPHAELERALLAAGHAPERGRIHGRSFRVPGASPESLPGWDNGWFAVQDEASSWVVDVLDPRTGDLVLDACAGPGGKAADIACRAGAVVAADVSPDRARLVRGMAGRLGVRARLTVQDAARPGLREGFDRILVDAPCSGIGAARRRPELLWRPSRTDLSSLARLQVRLAAASAALLRPGGVLVYSVCTFPRAETDVACDALLGRVPGLRPDPFPGPDGREVERARLWPHRHDTDAMFVARFRRGD